ncbi:hypothetical protein IKE82_01890 [Candidatus Saccharibacteria bacterium]|nr:hypothetical protein [Candidatus Saccharibacteria bacterium]
MKKTHKKILGFLGLVSVVAMTIFAALLPTPSASATETATVTDVIQVRVLDETPSVSITNPKSGDLITSLDEPITIDYVYLRNYDVTVTYIDSDGIEHTELLASTTTPEETGEKSYSFREIGEEYGYGKYIIRVTGEGLDGSSVQDSIQFEYAAITADVTMDDDTGTASVDLQYDTDDAGLDDDEKVVKVVINVYDENGNLVPEISPIVVNAPNKHVEIPFGEYGVPSGTYKLILTPYNASGTALYREIVLYVKYEEMLVPDTGGLFKGLNISQSDYLITGIGIFLVVGIGGIVFISRRGKNTTKRRK